MTEPKPRPDKVAANSANPQTERLSGLRELFPEAFAEGQVDFDRLRTALGDSIDDRPERYTFSWAGKRDAQRILQVPTRATLLPCPDESVDWDTTSHLFIEGDNLEVLKLLLKPYYGRVKMIYIDPPYNTGNDFVYPDNYADPLATYLRLTRQADEDGNLLTSNPETSGRYHSAWLSMMYPRLFLARQLLCEDGVIFVSIDDHEVHNLRLLMNEVFGEENYYATIAWQKKDTPSNDAQGISVNHEYVATYVRSPQFDRRLIPRTDEQLLIYKNPDDDPRGVWTRTALTRKEFVERDYYAIRNPQGREVYPPPGTSWRVSRKTLQRLIDENRLWWGMDSDGDMPFVKRFLSEVQPGVVPTTWWGYKFAGSNRNAKMEIRGLFDNDAPFETPKPSRLVARLLEISTAQDDLILDFFAGSCTTAQAALELNREDGGNRRFIMVQLPEPTGRSDYSTIADIGKERIRRVIARMRAADQGKLDLHPDEDLGFRVFRLAPSNYRSWSGVAEATPESYAQQLVLFADPLVEGWTPEAVIAEVALKEAGFGLGYQVQRVESVPDQVVYRVSDADKGQFFLICLDDRVALENLAALALSEGALFVCRDNALDDTAAANLALQCRLRTI